MPALDRHSLLIHQLVHGDRNVQSVHGTVVVEVHAGSALDIDQQTRRVHGADIANIRHAVVVVVVVAGIALRIADYLSGAAQTKGPLA